MSQQLRLLSRSGDTELAVFAVIEYRGSAMRGKSRHALKLRSGGGERKGKEPVAAHPQRFTKDKNI